MNSAVLWALVLLVLGNAMSVDTDTFFVTEGDSFTLKHDKRKTEEDQEIWMYHDGIRYIIGRCDYLKCTFGNKELGDRLKVYENGSLTITNTTVTDSGDYHITTNSKSILSTRSYSVVVRGFFSFDTDGVSVMEGDSVTLHTGVQMKREEKISDQMTPKKIITWYFNQTKIARILGDHPFFGDRSFICTDDECKERFRDRLKLDHETGSLTIRDIRTTDSGLYDLLINWDHILSWVRSSNVSSNTKIFIVAVHGVPAAERHEMKTMSVKEEESVTLDTRITKNPHHSITWYFNDSLIAEITGDLSFICTDVQCKDAEERFRDRLKLDHQTGSLTIRDTRTTDSGLYKLQISSNRFSISRISTVLTVNAVPDSGLSPAVIARIGVTAAVVVLLTAAAAAVSLCHRARRKNPQNNHDQGIELKDVPRDQSMTPCIPPEVNAMRPIMDIM